jgi:hypothetical protein
VTIDLLEILRDHQDRQDPFGERMSLEEWRIEKARGGQVGRDITGHLSTYSQAPTGPNSRRSGMQGVGYNGANPPDRDPWFGQQNYGVQFGREGARPSQYRDERPFQPPPFIDDADMGNIWYSPMQPVWPFGPPYYSRPREWNFPVGYNLNYIQPRMELMQQLRGMRASWGLLSTVETTRQDQLLRLPWTIQRRDKPKAASRAVDELRKFFRRPDGKLTYGQWSRKLMFDLFDIDSPYIYLDRGVTGKVQHAEVLDGATIFPLIDDAGRRPTSEFRMDDSGVTYIHRQPAYQQIIYGLPMINLSEDEIIYAMMRPRPEAPMFGYSPVEMIMIEAMEGIRKTFYQLEFWRSGSMPELIVTVPDAWTPRQIATFQGHFDALLSGQLSLKSKVRFVPGGMKPFDIKNASGESLWSQRDELLARLVCFAFSISPTPFVRQMNRATAQTAQQTAQEEGLYPFMSWWKDDIMDTIIQEKLGYEDVEFVFLPRPEVDLLKQAQIHQIQFHNGIGSVNEIRDELGREPIKGGDEHFFVFGSGAVKYEDVLEGRALLPGAPAPGNQGQGPGKSPDSTPDSSSSPMRGPAKPHGASTLPQPGQKLGKGKASEIQQAVGNFKKEHLSVQGLSISIENPKGSKRGEKDEYGVDRRIRMPAAYGYIRGVIGADGMQMDVYVGKYPSTPFVFVIDQDKFTPQDRDNGFDEHKVMLGYKNLKRALQDYLSSHFDGLGHERASAVTQVSIYDLKQWFKSGDLKKPISEQRVGRVVFRRGETPITKSDTISTSTGLLSYDQGRRRKRKKKKSSPSSGPRWLELNA